MTYSTDRHYYRLSDAPRGKPAPQYRSAFDALLPALFGLFAGLALVAYVAQVVT